jgi:hypothetical protein
VRFLRGDVYPEAAVNRGGSYAGKEWKQELYGNQPAPEGGPGGDAQGRRHHGRDERRAGPHCRGGRRHLGHGSGARAGHDPRRGRRGPHGQALLIKQIIQAVSIPVMAKARIGHFAEAQILQELGVDFIDESEVLTPADEAHHIDKHAFTTPFVCGARNLGEALRRIAEGAAMIRTKGEAGTGDVVHAVQHMRQITARCAP